MNPGRSLLAYVGLIGLAVIAGSAPAASAADKPVVVIETSLGKITVELEPEKTPVTVENFLKYVDKGYYDNTVFHRVISNFMIQGGGYDKATMKEKITNPTIKNESLAKNPNGISNLRGTIAMARRGDPDSASSQFFINLFDTNKKLDTYDNAGYTAFGKVIDGMDVVDKIAKVETGTAVLTTPEGEKQPSDDVPVKPVTIISIKRKK